jgi:transcriptional regulator of arginine metabolism
MYIYALSVNKYSKKEGENTKLARQRALLELIHTSTMSTQGELVARLRAEGFACTQVSVSRDIRELGLVKQGGRYTAPHESPSGETDDLFELAGNIAAFMRDISVVGDNLIVVKTLPGTAHSVGLLLDNLGWPDIAGTVAGDDTVFVAAHGGQKGCVAVADRLRDMTRKGR